MQWNDRFKKRAYSSAVTKNDQDLKLKMPGANLRIGFSGMSSEGCKDVCGFFCKKSLSCCY